MFQTLSEGRRSRHPVRFLAQPRTPAIGGFPGVGMTPKLRVLNCLSQRMFALKQKPHPCKKREGGVFESGKRLAATDASYLAC
jgi:hypothetical protein